MLIKIVTIMWHERATTPLRVIRKSYARFRKHGLGMMKKRLDAEYYALKSGKLDRSGSIQPYRKWIALNEKGIDSPCRVSVRRSPLLSIVVAVEDPSPRFLKVMVNSIRLQSHRGWELCIVYRRSTPRPIVEFFEKIGKKGKRIRVTEYDGEGDYGSLVSKAVGIARGEYILFMGAEDRLSPNALCETASLLIERPSVKVIYSDEDRIGEHGVRFDPHFKPDWNHDFFLSGDYIGGMFVVRKDILVASGGVREGYGDATTYDLMLRILPSITMDEIAHLPKILYHRRQVESERTESCGKSFYMKALRDYFDREGPDGVELSMGIADGLCRVRYPVPSPQPKVTIVIPTRDGYTLLRKCIDSIVSKTEYDNYEIVIVDNQSRGYETLRYFEYITEKFDFIRLMKYDDEFNYSAINNMVVKSSDCDIVAFVNDDVEIISTCWLSEMVSHALRPDIGVVGAKLYYDNGTIQHAGVVLGIRGVAGHSHKYYPAESCGYYNRLVATQNYSAVTGACMVVEKKIFEEVGGFDEENLKVAFNDIDLCLEVAKAGYRNLWTPYAEAYHHESVSRGSSGASKSTKRFADEVDHMINKWGNMLYCDPYYNPSLTLESENFSLKMERYRG